MKRERKASSRAVNLLGKNADCVFAENNITVWYWKNIQITHTNDNFCFTKTTARTERYGWLYFSRTTTGPVRRNPKARDISTLSFLRAIIYSDTVRDDMCLKVKDPSDYAVIRAYCSLRLIAFPIIVRIDRRAHKRYAWHATRLSKRHTIVSPVFYIYICF